MPFNSLIEYDTPKILQGAGRYLATKKIEKKIKKKCSLLITIQQLCLWNVKYYSSQSKAKQNIWVPLGREIQISPLSAGVSTFRSRFQNITRTSTPNSDWLISSVYASCDWLEYFPWYWKPLTW